MSVTPSFYFLKSSTVLITSSILLYRYSDHIKHVTKQFVLPFISQHFIQKWFSYFLDATRVAPEVYPHHLRNSFRSIIWPQIKPRNPTHSHPESAAWRSSVGIFGKRLASQTGLVPYMYQAAPTDLKCSIAYSRTYYWAKDTLVPTKEEPILPHHLIIIVDVDYYVDFPTFLLENVNPILLYTCQPTSVATDVGEFCFFFDRENNIHYSVSGGGYYEHKIWNFGVDVIAISGVRKTVYYLVERRALNQHHEAVFLVPIGSWIGYFASYLAKTLHSGTLSRLKVNQGDFNVLDVKTKDEIMRSVGRVNEYNCAKIPVSVFNAIHSVVRTSNLKISMPSVLSWVDEHGGRATAVVLTDYFRSECKNVNFTLVYEPVQGLLSYQIPGTISAYESDVNPLMLAFMSPIVPGAFVPDKSINNERAAVLGRIVNPAIESIKLAGPPSKWLMETMEAFVEQLIPEPFKHHPVDLDYVYEQQHRPTQRSLLNKAETMLPVRIADTFLKAEAYQKPSDPRIITTYNTVDKRDYSTYIYSITQYMQQQSWYAFGKNPKEISETVCEICEVSEYVILADAVRMDGHLHQYSRDLERMVLLRFFRKEYHNELMDLYSSQFNIPARTKQRIKYFLDCQRGSGSAETAVFNGTTVSKFIDFSQRVNTGSTYTAAFKALGIFAGDDSLTSPISQGDPIVTLVEAAAKVGQNYEVEICKRFSKGVNFLSRYYTEDVWCGETASTCDLHRVLSKLHVTVALNNVSAIEKLQQKLSGLWRSDRNTPIIKQILQACDRIKFKLDKPLNIQIAGWWAKYDMDVNWPNEYEFDLKEVIDKNVYDTTKLFEYLLELKTPEQLLTLPAICEIADIPVVVKQLTVVNDVVYTPTEKLDKENICKEYLDRACKLGSKCPKQHVQICNDFKKGLCKRMTCKFKHIKF